MEDNFMDRPAIEKGRKFDESKPKWHLIPWKELEEIVFVLNHGAQKYSAYNWQKVQPGKERYFDACIRHLVAWRNGERFDKESKLNHLAHAGCCLLFMLWFDNQDPK